MQKALLGTSGALLVAAPTLSALAAAAAAIRRTEDHERVQIGRQIRTHHAVQGQDRTTS
jgi:chorismate-pyruvate lyase